MDHAVAATCSCCWSPEPHMYPHRHTHTLPRTGQPQERQKGLSHLLHSWNTIMMMQTELERERKRHAEKKAIVEYQKRVHIYVLRT